MNVASQTRHTLLRRACEGRDERAWDELVEHYRRFIYHILGELGVALNDQEDLSQQILVALNRDLASYDRSRAKFRSWFGKVIRNVAYMHFRKVRTRGDNLERFRQEQSLGEANSEPVITRMIAEEWSLYLSNLAMERVRPLFKGQAIQVFDLGLEGYGAEEIAQRTGLTLSSVYTLRKRVKKRLYLEIRDLSNELEG